MLGAANSRSRPHTKKRPHRADLGSEDGGVGKREVNRTQRALRWENPAALAENYSAAPV